MARNADLEQELRNLGYSYKGVTGYYRENGEDKFAREQSYLVFDNYDDIFEFTNRMYELSTRFNQDSFLLRPKGEKQAAQLAYADNSGKVEIFSKMHINSKAENAYTKIGKGTLVFE